MEAAEVIKRKRRYIALVRAVSIGSALLFPFAFLFFLDPPQPELPLAPVIWKAFVTLYAAGNLWWMLKRGLPQLREAPTVTQLFLRGLLCINSTFTCAICGVLAFIADSPRLGSPLIVLPYILVAVAVDWRYTLPQMEAYEPTSADLGVATL